MMAEWLARARFWARRRKRGEMDEELRFHVERLAAQKEAKGLNEAEARRQALIEFGGVERTRAGCSGAKTGSSR